MNTAPAYVEAREHCKAAADAARAALKATPGPEQERATLIFFAKLMVAHGMSYHPDGYDADNFTFGEEDHEESMWPILADAIAVTQAEELVHSIPGLDPYDAFIYWNVTNDYELKEDENDPETHQWHLAELKKLVDVMVPGWTATAAAKVNRDTGTTFTGPWIFARNDNEQVRWESEFWELVCRAIDWK